MLGLLIGVDEGEGELRREQPGQGAKPGEDADSARGAAAILVARAGEERGRGELRGAREGGLRQYQGRGRGLELGRDAWAARWRLRRRTAPPWAWCREARGRRNGQWQFRK